MTIRHAQREGWVVVLATCELCGHTWHAGVEPQVFGPHVSSRLLLECPQCGLMCFQKFVTIPDS